MWGVLAVVNVVATVASFVPALNVIAAPIATVTGVVLAVKAGADCATQLTREGCTDAAIEIVSRGTAGVALRAAKNAAKAAHDAARMNALNKFPKGVRGRGRANRGARKAYVRAAQTRAVRTQMRVETVLRIHATAFSILGGYRSLRGGQMI